MGKIRSAAVAGQFYPADAETLKYMVDAFLDDSSTRIEGRVQAVIVPHAGYVYSGAVAARAYTAIAPSAVYDRIFILGPSHREAFHGAAVDGDCETWLTPLGKVPVDVDTCKALSAADDVFRLWHKPFEKEHCLEVQLPFLQERLRQMPPVVPIIIGSVEGDYLGRIHDVLRPYMTPENLFVISSDFSHYPSYEDACRVDKATGDAILSGSLDKFLDTLLDNASQNIPNLATSACGQLPIAVLLLMMQGREDLRIRHLDYCNSGDSQYGDKDGVVGYHAFSIEYKQVPKERTDGFSLTAEERAVLLKTARKSIEEAFVGQRWLPEEKELTPALKAKCGAFVTLNLHGHLRGCIGSLTGVRPLYMTVAEMACAAAFEDPRFDPLSRRELGEVRIEISVLSPLRKITSVDELELGRHGILIVKDGHSGTFLPQVADETGWTKEEFLGHCSRDKAGLSWDGWKDADLYVYEAEVFDEQ